MGKQTIYVGRPTSLFPVA